MNAAVRLYAEATNARTKQDNGFDLSEYDERTLRFAREYSDKLLAVDVNLKIDEMLDTAWKLFDNHFSKVEVGIREDLVNKYWPNGETKVPEKTKI
jgi:V/A-type H+-transporting ATPase subunit B